MSYSRKSIREIERKSIRDFVEANKHLLVGNVLDFGSGLQPYRNLVTGEYFPYDIAYDKFPSNKGWPYDAVLCTQVIEYAWDPKLFLKDRWDDLRECGWLVMTFPTTWEEVEDTDYWRFTKAGMQRLLKGFKNIQFTPRPLPMEDFNLMLGYGVICQR